MSGISDPAGKHILRDFSHPPGGPIVKIDMALKRHPQCCNVEVRRYHDVLSGGGGGGGGYFAVYWMVRPDVCTYSISDCQSPPPPPPHTDRCLLYGQTRRLYIQYQN